MGQAAGIGSLTGAAVLVVAALMLLTSLGCFTPIPRPGKTPPSTPEVTQPPTVSPTATPEVLLEPTPVLEPTATAVPVPAFTSTPDPGPTPPPSVTPQPTDDSGGLMLQVYAPEDGATVPGSSVVVYGQTVPDATVFISGIETEVDAQGGFRADVGLAPAENQVEIVAQNDQGLRTRVSRTVTSLALPFLLLITEPENESVVSVSSLPLSGRTGPNAIVSINGRSVPVDRFGYFSSTVQLDEGPNVIDVVATNDDGRTLSTVLAVIYRAPAN